jgi:integrase/recombinase XerD
MNRQIRRQPTADWPARDRALWEKGVESKGLFENGGAGANWSEATRFKTARGYGYFLSWLATRDLLDPNLGPCDRVSRERVAAYIAEITPTRAPNTVLGHIRELHDAMRVMAPQVDWNWLLELYRTLSARVRPARDKFSRLRSIAELVALGEHLMEEAEMEIYWSPIRRAVRFRDGLIISLLAYRPVRQKNFTSMSLVYHLIKVGGRWQILFADNETKTRVPYEAVFPAALAPRLERYLALHRAVLLRGERADGQDDAPPVNPRLEAVWVSEVGTQLKQGPLACRIRKHTKEAFEQSVSPHMFRDCAATSIAVDNPKHIGDAALVLGHSGQKMTEKHYNHARSLEASRRHAATLVGLRETLRVAWKG